MRARRAASRGVDPVRPPRSAERPDPRPRASAPSACPACLRRAWLLAALNGRLEYRGRDHARLVSTLELSDRELIHAIGAGERARLWERYAQLEASQMRAAEGVRRICRHDARFPRALAGWAGAPRTLHLSCEIPRMVELLAQPVVAIVGARRASDYGMEVAHGLARGLAASGITVLSGLAEGIPAAAHLGALQARGPTMTVMAGGVDISHPATWRALHRRIAAEGCALAELPCGCAPRSWCHVARARIVAALAQMVIVVEAGERPAELLHARLAQASGTTVAAVPGRVSAPAARGPHALLREGAVLVRDAQDALDALYGVGGRQAAGTRPELGPRLREVVDRVGAGCDTIAKLTAQGADANATLLALAQLELRGAVVRGDGGRYVACV
jgi:DNA processing protein